VSNQVEIIYLSSRNSKETGEIFRREKALVESGLNAPINVMPDPREGGDTRGIGLISLLLGWGFDFI
jgi:hypothetical protein